VLKRARRCLACFSRLRIARLLAEVSLLLFALGRGCSTPGCRAIEPLHAEIVDCALRSDAGLIEAIESARMTSPLPSACRSPSGCSDGRGICRDQEPPWLRSH